MLILDHVELLNLLLLNVDLVEVLLLIQLQHLDAVFYCFNVPLGLDQVLDCVE